MQFKTLIAVGVAAVALASATASGAAINTPIPTNAYITVGGLDWAWGSPLPDANGNLAFQGAFGWRLPTDAEIDNAPLGGAFVFLGANVPLNGADPVSGAVFNDNASLTGAAACASPYFGSGYSHCDWSDGAGQPFSFWAGQEGSDPFSDQLYVRTATGAIPEPSTWAMLILGFGSLGVMMRRRRVLAPA